MYGPEDGLVVEYAVRDVHKPIGVSTFRLTAALPAELRGSLPTVEQLEAELAGVEVGEEGRDSA